MPHNPIAPEPAPAGVSHKDSRFLLNASIFVVVMAYLLTIRPDGRVAFFFAPGLPLPDTCPSRLLANIDCPGCGLTRSTISLAHGHWRESLAFNPVGTVLAVLIVLQIPYRIMLMKHGRCPGVPAIVERVTPYLLIAGLLGNWIVRLLV